MDITYFLLAIPVILLFLLIRFWIQQGYYHNEIKQVRDRNANQGKKQTATLEPVSHLTSTTLKVADESMEDSVSKGQDFEKFVIELFRKEYFFFLEWRSDKIHNGIYPASNRDPDMVWRFSSSYATQDFAVECKWRSKFHNGQIQWAKDYQLSTYKAYQRDNDIPVFVVVGIGGVPSNPKEMYIIPLQDIKTAILFEHQIAPFKRYSPSKKFFINLHDMVLE